MKRIFLYSIFFLYILFSVYPIQCEEIYPLETESLANKEYYIQKDVFSNLGISWKTPEYTLYSTLGQPTPINPLKDVDINNFSGFFHPRKNKIPGYAILAVGSVKGQEGLDSHTKTANNIYQHLINRGFALSNKNDPNDLIKYFNPKDEIQLYEDVYEVSRESNYKIALQDAITNWAIDKLKETAAPLYIILINHGYKDKFYLTEDDELHDTDLNAWLTILEEKMEELEIVQPILIFMGSCYSGSFINELSKPNKNRIIVTSTSSDEVSYRGPVISDEKYRIRDGDFFISTLFSELGQGLDLKTSFYNARIRTTIHTDNGIDLEKKYPYFNSAMQHPLLDDNGDGIGSYYLSNSGDGNKAEKITLGWNDKDSLKISQFGCEDEDMVLTENQSLKIWAEVSDKSITKKVWVEIRKPNVILSGGKVQQTIALDYKSLDYIEYQGRYEADIEDLYFDTPGKYTIFFYIKDNNDIIMPTEWLFVYKQIKDNLSPIHFSLISPVNEANVRTSLILNWERSYDRKSSDVNRLKYSIYLYKDNLPDKHLDKIEKHGIEETIYQINLPESWDKYKIYWHVRAIDEFGSYTDTDIWTFNTDNTGKEDSFIIGHVYNTLTGRKINSASVFLDNSDDKYDLEIDDGCFWGQYFEGKYKIEAFAECYESNSLSVTLKKGKKNTEFFRLGLMPKRNYNEMNIYCADINCDEKLDIIDIIISLKILSGDDTTDDTTIKYYYNKLANCEKFVSFELFIRSMKYLCGF